MRSEAEIHWRAFLDSLIDRGMRGVRFIVSDDHAGLKAARRAVLPGAIWQRCQFHLATAVLVDFDEDWATSHRIYINWHSPDADRPNSESPDLRLLNR